MHSKESKYFTDGILDTTDKIIFDDEWQKIESIHTRYFIGGGKLETHYVNNSNGRKLDEYYIYESPSGNRTELEERHKN